MLRQTSTVMAGATISPALPAIELAFADTSNATLLTQLALTMPALLITLSAPVAGILLDKIGRKPVLIHYHAPRTTEQKPQVSRFRCLHKFLA